VFDLLSVIPVTAEVPPVESAMATTIALPLVVAELNAGVVNGEVAEFATVD
jgi:hypothetical protein